MLAIDYDDTPKGFATCRAMGETDAFTVSQFRASLAAVGPQSPLIIDLGGVAFVDSAGLGALIDAVRRKRDQGGRAALTCAQPAVGRLLRTTGFNRVVTVAKTAADAKAAHVEVVRLPASGGRHVKGLTGHSRADHRVRAVHGQALVRSMR